MVLKLPLAAAFAISLAMCAPALAQTAAAVDAPVARNADPALDAQISAYLNGGPQTLPAVRDAGPDLAEAPTRDRKVHGEVGASIGTGGYREAHASMIAPVGESGTVAIAVGQGRGRGLWGPQTASSLSLAGSVGAGAGFGADRAVPSCASLKDKTAIEPLWVTRLRATNPAADINCRP